MKFSNFGQKFTQDSPILQLMDDLGNALSGDKPVNMLGGGNPANITEVSTLFQGLLESAVTNQEAVHSITNYAAPQGDARFIDVLVAFFNRHYDWNLTSQNIALTNGSQNAFFYLFNLFAGEFCDSTQKSILLPMAPEYIGYADVQIQGANFVSLPPVIEKITHNNCDGFFKYKVDFEALEALPSLKNNQIGAICCSRPANPTGNVLTDDEMARLEKIAKKYDIPLIIDNAYGEPFPDIIHTETKLIWNHNIILCFSLSKIGLPGVRTGIVIADSKIIQTISNMNAIINLSPTRFGAVVTTPLFENDEILRVCNNAIRPFYRQQTDFAIDRLKEEFIGLPVYIHKPEGAIFLWVWFENLPISTTELYQILKQKGTLIIPSEHFFVGMNTENYPHARQCIRLSVAQNNQILNTGIAMIGEVVRRIYHQLAV